MEAESRQRIADEIERQLRPRVGIRKWDEGFNCCGCSTYDDILDAAKEIVLGTYRAPTFDDLEDQAEYDAKFAAQATLVQPYVPRSQ